MKNRKHLTLPLTLLMNEKKEKHGGHAAGGDTGISDPAPLDTGKLVSRGYLPSPWDFDPHRIALEPDLRLPAGYLEQVMSASSDHFLDVAFALRQRRTKVRASHLSRPGWLSPNEYLPAKTFTSRLLPYWGTEEWDTLAAALDRANTLTASEGLSDQLEMIAIDHLATSGATLTEEQSIDLIAALERLTGTRIVLVKAGTSEIVYGIGTLEWATSPEVDIEITETTDNPDEADIPNTGHGHVEDWFLACARLGMRHERCDQAIRALEVVETYLDEAACIPPPSTLWKLGFVVSRKPWTTILFSSLIDYWAERLVSSECLERAVEQAVQRAPARPSSICTVQLLDGTRTPIPNRNELNWTGRDDRHQDLPQPATREP